MSTSKENPFFSNSPGGGMAGLDASMHAIAKEEVTKAIDDMLTRIGFKNKTIVRTVG